MYLLLIVRYLDCKMSFFVVEFFDEELVTSLAEKIILTILWLSIEILGNGLLLGLIEFERIGGDPMKRRIVDQVRLLLTEAVCISPYFSKQIFWANSETFICLKYHQI